jgi:Xaa-Pro aminopeptidase
MHKIHRQNVLNCAIKRFGCDTIAAFSPENIFYLTGYWGEGITVTNEEGKTILITPRLETERAINTSNDCDVVTAERGGRLISHFVSVIKNKKTCIDCLDHSIFETLKQRLNNPRGLLTNKQPFFDARMIKDEKEISTISKAAVILDKLYEICTERIKEGLSERRLQAILIYHAMKLGASPPSYRWTLDPLIIASGPNGAQPHAQISDRKFKSGDMIIVDLTLRHKGYIADATRTFGLGTISNGMKKVYEVVRESQESGVKAVSEGVTCGDIDHTCRQVIQQSGFNESFVHSTGHGIGLDVHEPPWIRVKNRQKLRNNMSITIEPGIYLQDRFGVRIEDSVVVRRNEKNLCRFTKELIVKG